MALISNTKGDDWKKVAGLYKQFTGRASHKSVDVILDRLNEFSPFVDATGIHDNGCGPGVVISRLIERYGSEIPPSCALTCSDFSAAMVEQVEQTKEATIAADAASPWSRVEASVLDAMDLKGIRDASKSHVTAGWVYFMTPDPQKCLAESKRILKPDGMLGLSSWKDSQIMELMRMAGKVKPDMEQPSLPKAWSDATLLKGEMETAGFRDVVVHEIDVEIEFSAHEPFLDVMMTKMPQLVSLLKNFTEEEVASLKETMLAQIKEWCPSAPGALHGVSLIALGRK